MGNYPFIILLQEVLDVVYVSQSLCFMHKLPGEITYSFLFQFCQISLIVAFLPMGALCRIGEEIIYVVIIDTWGSFVYKGSVEVFLWLRPCRGTVPILSEIQYTSFLYTCLAFALVH